MIHLVLFLIETVSKLNMFNGQWLSIGALCLHSLAIVPLFAPLVAANWQYKSRPDLSPPTLNITVSTTADELSLGYIFVAPYSFVPWSERTAHGPLQPGPYIFTSAGELVWSGFGYFTGWATNFQVAKWEGEDILFAFEGSRNTAHGHSHGHAKLLNRNYETVKEVRGGNHEVLDLHEFHIVDQKTALVESYSPLPYDLQRYGTKPESQWIVDARFQGTDSGVFRSNRFLISL